MLNQPDSCKQGHGKNLLLAAGRRYVLPLCGTLLIVGLLLSKLDLDAVAKALKPRDSSLLVAACLLSTLCIVHIGALKLIVLARQLKVQLGMREALFIILSGNPLRLALPLKTGELVKALYLSSRHGLAWEKGVALMVLDKVFNVSATLSFLLIGVWWFRTGYTTVVIALLLVFPVLIVGFESVYKRFPLDTLEQGGRLSRGVRRFLAPFTVLSWRSKVYLFLLSLILLTGYLTASYLLFLAYGVPVPVKEVVAWIPFTILMTGLPVTFAGIGAREASIMMLFTQWATPEQLVGIGAAMSVFLNALPELVGLPLTALLLKRIQTPTLWTVRLGTSNSDSGTNE